MTTLKNNDRLQLEAAYRVTRDKRTANSINLLLLMDDGYSQSEVAAILRLDQSTVSRQVQQYLTQGLAQYLESPFGGGKCKLDASQLTVLEQYLDDNLCASTDEVIAFVEQKFSINYTRSGMAALLKRLGFVFKKPILIPGKADAALQEAFIDYYNALKESMGNNDKIYFLDGVHPQHNTVAASGWIRKGKEKQLKSNTGRRRVNLNGALDPDTQEVIIRADNTLDSRSTIELFKMIENNNPNANKIVLVIDNAPYYYNGDVIQYAQESNQLELVYLPPYSPNLNLIERVWRFMKKTALHNRYHETFNDFKKTIGDFFQQLPKYDELADLLTEEFQVIRT